MAPDSKGTLLGIVVLAGCVTEKHHAHVISAVSASVAAPLSGHWSDVRGARKPFMIAGMLLSCLSKLCTYIPCSLLCAVHVECGEISLILCSDDTVSRWIRCATVSSRLDNDQHRKRHWYFAHGVCVKCN